MKKKLFLPFLSYLFVGLYFMPQAQEATLLQVGDLKVSADEFAYLYEKNYENSDSLYMREHVEDYLALYTKFKLKVAAAYSQGFDTTNAFVSELAGYQKQLAKPYLSDPSITEEIIQEAYSRLQNEVAASHILIRVADWSNPADTLKAYNKALKLKKEIEAGEDFDKMAVQYSEDPSAKANKGYLGYFTSMQMVYPFESAVYKGEKGELVGPVRTQFGYHVLLVKDKIPARGMLKTSHIMVRASEGISPKDSTTAVKKVQSIYQQLKEGESWDDLCGQFSDDTNSKSKGGALPWFSTGQMVPSFAEAAFELQKIGEISEPIKTPYGWHIIRLDGKKGVLPLDSLRRKIRQRISKDSRSQLSEKRFVAKLQKENGFKEYPDVLSKALTIFDKTLNDGKWVAPKPNEDTQKTLFQIGDENLDVQSFYLFVAANQRKGMTLPPNMYAKKLYEEYVTKQTLRYEEEHLSEKYAEYRHLLNEYKEGIMLFNIMTEEVWEKAMSDSAGLRAYHERHREDYRWKERAKAVIASMAKAEMLPEIKKALEATLFPTQLAVQPLQFAQNAKELTAQHQQQIDKVTLSLRRNPKYRVRVIATYTEGEKELANERVALVQKRWAKYKFEEERIMVEYKKGQEAAAGSIVLEVLTPSPKALEKVYNADAPLNLEIKEGWFERGEEQQLSQVEWKQGEYTTEANGRKVYIRIDKTEEPRNKDFEECRGPLIADYQTYLEDEWLEKLQKEYAVKVNKRVLKKLLKKNKR